MEWRILFLAPDTIDVTTPALTLWIRRWGVRLPRLLRITVKAVETADPELADTMPIKLVLSHWLLGSLLGYEGTFEVERKPHPANLDKLNA